uniref:Uncharacterized protein n=1 Tax=Parastrongyloides trichosuri TaxID=131310 RepID=A0A0N4Z6F4_PARTI
MFDVLLLCLLNVVIFTSNFINCSSKSPPAAKDNAKKTKSKKSNKNKKNKSVKAKDGQKKEVKAAAPPIGKTSPDGMDKTQPSKVITKDDTLKQVSSLPQDNMKIETHTSNDKKQESEKIEVVKDESKKETSKNEENSKDSEKKDGDKKEEEKNESKKNTSVKKD